MPKGKKAVHDLLSPKIAKKRIARRNAGLAAARDKLENNKENAPPTVDNFRVNKPLFGPHKIKKKPVEVKQRNISRMEGKPTVNAKVATKQNYIHKPVVKKAISIDEVPLDIAKKPKKRRRTKDAESQTK